MGAGRKPKSYHDAVAAGEIKLMPKVRVARVFRNDPCFVYVVHEIDCPDVCKIGIANNTAKRFSHLQVSTWRALKLAHCLQFPSEEIAFAVEQRVHESLGPHHRRGEWFSVSPDVAVREVRRSAGMVGIRFIDPITVEQGVEIGEKE